MRMLLGCALALMSSCLWGADFTVTNLNDSGAGSLRQAIVDAEALAGSDVIYFDSGLSGTITLASPLPTVTTFLTVLGNGPANVTISGAGARRVFSFGAGARLDLRYLTIANGASATVGGAVYGTCNSGTAQLALSDCVLRDSTAQGGAGIYVSQAIPGTLITRLSRCTFTGNSASQNGGVILAQGDTLETYCENCTFSGNSATGQGGAITLDAPVGYVELVQCTLTANTAATGGALRCLAGSMAMAGCILAGNLGPAGSPDGSGVITSLDGNLIGDASGMTITAQGGDQFGTGATPIDPLLQALADNGGPTPTCRIDNASPAVDAGASTFTPSEDQRSYSRVDAADCGAFELQPPQLSVQQTAGSIPDNANVFLTGSATPGVGRVETFTIRNLTSAGEKNLQITGVPLSGTSNCSFAVTATPAATVIPNGTTTLEITITPTTAGLYWCTFFIDNNDPNSFDYSLTLIGVADAPAGSSGGDDDDEGCSTSRARGPVWLGMLLPILLLGVRRLRRSAP